MGRIKKKKKNVITMNLLEKETIYIDIKGKEIDKKEHICDKTWL